MVLPAPVLASPSDALRDCTVASEAVHCIIPHLGAPLFLQIPGRNVLEQFLLTWLHVTYPQFGSLCHENHLKNTKGSKYSRRCLRECLKLVEIHT